jgi:hypothetical protein
MGMRRDGGMEKGRGVGQGQTPTAERSFLAGFCFRRSL